MTTHVSKSQAGGIPGHLVQAFLQKAVELGHDPARLLQRAGSRRSAARFLAEPAGVLPKAEAVAIYRETVLAFELQSRALDHLPTLPVREFELMCYCIINCATLGEAVHRCIDFFRTREVTVARLALEVAGGTARFSVNSVRGVRSTAAFLSDLVGLASFQQLFGWMIGFHIAPTAVELAYPPEFRRDMVVDFFDGQAAFTGTRNAFSFPAALLDRPVLRSYRDLLAILTSFPFDLLGPEYLAQRLSERLRMIYRTALAQHAPLPGIAELARLNNQSLSTFRRRLAEEGTSVRRIKDHCRRDLAESLLRQSDCTVEEIADRTGFSDPDSFRAAFRAWTGLLPSDYRVTYRGPVSLSSPSRARTIKDCSASPPSSATPEFPTSAAWR